VFFFWAGRESGDANIAEATWDPCTCAVGMLENNGKGCYCSLSAFFPLYPTSFFNAWANFLLLLYMFFFFFKARWALVEERACM